jgi:hypothetical protein
MQGDGAMIPKEQLREMKVADLVALRKNIDSVIQERSKSSGMDLLSIAANTSTGYVRAAVKSPTDETSESWPFG